MSSFETIANDISISNYNELIARRPSGVYLIVNTVNDKKYVGLSNDVRRRWNEHASRYSNTHGYLYNAMKKYGFDAFNFYFLEEAEIDRLSDLEAEYIKFYNTVENGYNMISYSTREAFYKLTPITLAELIEDLKESILTYSELEEKYPIKRGAIGKINQGKAYYDSSIDYPIRKKRVYSSDNTGFCVDCGEKVYKQSKRCRKCAGILSRVTERPPKEWLLKNVAERGYTNVGAEYDVTDNTIRNWCIDEGLPNNIADIQRMFGNYVEKEKKVKSVRRTWINIKIKSPTSDEILCFKDISSLVVFFKNKEEVKAKDSSIRASIVKVLNGSRKSYMGYTMTGEETNY